MPPTLPLLLNLVDFGQKRKTIKVEYLCSYTISTIGKSVHAP
jgi:hypothetical protein